MTSRVGLHIRSSHILTDGMPVVKVNQSAWRRSPIPSAKTVSFDSASRPFREEITAPFDAKAERQGRTLCPLSRLVFHLLATISSSPSLSSRASCPCDLLLMLQSVFATPTSPFGLCFLPFLLLSSSPSGLLLRGFRPVLLDHALLCFRRSSSSERIRVDFLNAVYFWESNVYSWVSQGLDSWWSIEG